MLIRVFKDLHPLSIVLTLGVIIVLWIPLYLHPFKVLENGDLLFGFILSLSTIKSVHLTISLLLIIFEAYLLYSIINKHRLSIKPSAISIIIFILLNTFFLQEYAANPIIIANGFVLLCLTQLTNLYNLKSGLNYIFNASLFISLGTLVYTPVCCLLILVWVACISVKPTVWRDFAISIIGFILPFIYLLAYNIITQKPLIPKTLTNTPSLYSPLEINYLNGTIIAIVTLLTLFGVYTAYNNLHNLIIKQKKYLGLFLWFILFVAGIVVLFNLSIISLLTMFSIPLTLVISLYLTNSKKNWLSNLMFFSLIIGIGIYTWLK